MGDFRQNLRNVMYKIANYVPWQEEEVNEDDFRILNQATGADLASVSYQHRISIARFIKNSEKLINDYNEKILLSHIRDVNTIKRSLQSTFAFKVKKLQQVEEENDGNVKRKSSDLIDINAELLRRNLITRETYQKREGVPAREDTAKPQPVASFASALQLESSSCHMTISLHRDEAHALNFKNITENLTANDQRRNMQIFDLNPDDDFGELNIVDAARLGVFDGVHGEKMFNSLQKSTTLGAEQQIENMQEIEAVDSINLAAIMKENPLLLIEQDLPPQIEPENPAQIVPENLAQIEPENPAQIDHSQLQGDAIRESNVFNERYENFRIAVQQAQNLGKNKPKLRQRRVNVRKVQNENGEDDENDEDVLILLNYCTKIKLQKIFPKRLHSLSIASCKPEVEMDIFDTIRVFSEKFVPFETREVATSVAEVPKISSLPATPHQHQKRSIASPLPPQPAKRICSDVAVEVPALVEHEFVSSHEVLLPPFIHTEEENVVPLVQNLDIKEAAVSPEAPPIHDPKPKIIPKDLHGTLESISLPVERRLTRQSAQLDPRRELSQRDAILDYLAVQSLMEEDKTSHLKPIAMNVTNEGPGIEASMQAIHQDAQVDHHVSHTNIPIPISSEIIAQRPSNEKSRSKAQTNARKTARIADETERSIPAVVINGEQFYEFQEQDGTVKRESKYQFDTFMLYMQVRLLMKKHCGREPWKMDVDRLLNVYKIQMGNKRNATAIKLRLYMLAHRGYFIPTFSDDGKEELVAIEIPLKRRDGNSSEKENVP